MNVCIYIHIFPQTNTRESGQIHWGCAFPKAKSGDGEEWNNDGDGRSEQRTAAAKESQGTRDKHTHTHPEQSLVVEPHSAQLDWQSLSVSQALPKESCQSLH